MTEPFPFYLPEQTQLYLILYVVTFALHQFFMHYTVAGSLYLFCTSWTSKPDESNPLPITFALRDWLPFQLSAAITAGVAPLLFVQVLYPQHFYTAHLLLRGRWFFVVPVLILAFYGLYLGKSQRLALGNPGFSRLLWGLISAGFLFVGFCWTSNYMVSIIPAKWTSTYQLGSASLGLPFVTSRMAIWLGASFATLAGVISWQLPSETDPSVRRHLGCVAMLGIALFMGACGAHLAVSSEGVREAVLNSRAAVYLIAVSAGVACQLIGWLLTMRAGVSGQSTRFLILTGVVLVIVGMSALREVTRWSQIKSAALLALHAESADIEGVALFALAATFNLGLMFFCVWICRSPTSQSRDSTSERSEPKWTREKR